MERFFTKSSFKQALFCPASLYYYYDREHYANQMNEDDFLQALADGGPDGEFSHFYSAYETLLQKERAVR